MKSLCGFLAVALVCLSGIGDAKPAAKAKAIRVDTRAADIKRYLDQRASWSTCADLKAINANLRTFQGFYAARFSQTGKKLSEVSPAKSDYETTSEYQERVNSAIGTYLGSVKGHVFIAPLSGDHVKYNADTQTLTISMFEQKQSFQTASDHLMTIHEYERNKGDKIGTTGLGVKFKYSTGYYYKQRLLLETDHLNIGSTWMWSGDKDVILDLDRVTALAARDSIFVIFGGEIDLEASSYDSDYHEPRLDEPYYDLYDTETFALRVDCAYLYDASRKLIIHDYTP